MTHFRILYIEINHFKIISHHESKSTGSENFVQIEKLLTNIPTTQVISYRLSMILKLKTVYCVEAKSYLCIYT